MNERTQKIRAVFSKSGDVRFISHLDLMRLFQRAFRRASLPVAITQGFSPHLKFSITRALKLGVESSSEELVVSMARPVEPRLFMESINAQLPDGVRVAHAEELN